MDGLIKNVKIEQMNDLPKDHPDYGYYRVTVKLKNGDIHGAYAELAPIALMLAAAHWLDYELTKG